MQPPGNLIGVMIELTAGVQNGHNDFQSRPAVQLRILMGHRPHGDTTSVINHGTTSIGVEFNQHILAITSHCLIYAVIEDFIDQVVQPAVARSADIHRRSLSDRSQSFKNGDLGRIIVATLRCRSGGAGIGCGLIFFHLVLLLQTDFKPERSILLGLFSVSS